MFLGLIYELIDRQHISYLHHEMAGQICMDLENPDHQQWRQHLFDMHDQMVKEVESITAQLDAEQAERERLEAERLAAEKAKKEEEARLAKEEEERQKKLAEEQAAEDERLRLLKCKD